MTGASEVLRDIEKQISALPKKTVRYECEKCRDTGFVTFAKNGYTFSQPCECFKRREARRLMMYSGISEEFNSKGFKNFEDRGIKAVADAKAQAVNYCKAFKQNERLRSNSILFCGQVGSGKTHLGLAICKNLIYENVSVKYMAYRNDVTKIKQLMLNETDYDSKISGYAKARVLYIDDFLKGKITESDVNIMYELINYRYMHNLPMIISTQKMPAEIMDFDEAIGSRILEMCRGNIVQMQGKELNYRLYGG